MQSRATIFAANGRVETGHIDMPAPGPDEVQVRTQYSMMSAGTEGWVLRQRFTWATTPFPCVPGYQRVGEITAVGAGVTHLHPGERVFATNGSWMGDTPPYWGAHIALANTLATEIYELPAAVDALDASGVVVAQVGYNAASRVVLQPGDWVIVYGDGLIGQCAAQALRARQARVILVGHRQERLALAKIVSADAVVNTQHNELLVKVRAITGQPFVTAVVDTVQQEAAQREYMPLLEYARGQIVYSGFTPGTTWADMALLQQQELTTHFVQGWTRARIEATIALMAQGQMRLQPLVTHRVAASAAPAMYQMVEEKTAAFLGVVLNWDE